jgi:hypothetical protein
VNETGDLRVRSCAACKTDLTYVGIRSFRTGGSDGITTALFQAFAEMGEDLLTVALYGCSSCGRLEMFLPPATAR